MKKLLMISTDRKIFEEGSAVRARQVEYAKKYDEVRIVIFTTSKFKVQSATSAENESAKQGVSQQRASVRISANCWAYPTLSSFKFLYPLEAIKLGKSIIEKKGITEITCQDSSLTAMAGVSLKKRFNIPLEIQIHEDIGSPYYGRTLSHKIRKMLALRYIPQADKIRAVSERIKTYLESAVLPPLRKGTAHDRGNSPLPQIEVRPIFVDVNRIRNAPVTVDLRAKYPRFEKVALMASRLESEKNIELAMHSWPEVLKSMPKAGLVIVGSGSQASKLEARSSKLGMASHIVFEPWADPATLASYYKTADLFVVTSFCEGYGMTLVEAQAAGCPIVSTDVGVAKEVGASIIGHADPAEAAAAIVRSLNR